MFNIQKAHDLLKDKGGGKKRRGILEYLLSTKVASYYQLAKAMYGDGIRYSRVTSKHIEKLKQVRIIKVEDATEKGRNKKAVSLTKYGRLFCVQIGLSQPSSAGEELLAELALMGEDFSDNEIEDGKRILNDEIVGACLEIFEGEIKKRKQALERMGYKLPFIEWTTQFKVKLKLDPISLYQVALAYTIERDILPQMVQFFEEYRNNPDMKTYFQMIQEMVTDKDMLVAHPKIKKLGLEKNFDELADWLKKIGEKIPAFTYLPYLLPGPSWLDSMHLFVTTIANSQIDNLLARAYLAKELRKLKDQSTGDT